MLLRSRLAGVSIASSSANTWEICGWSQPAAIASQTALAHDAFLAIINETRSAPCTVLER